MIQLALSLVISSMTIDHYKIYPYDEVPKTVISEEQILHEPCPHETNWIDYYIRA